jgi:hypothetical protein
MRPASPNALRGPRTDSNTRTLALRVRAWLAPAGPTRAGSTRGSAGSGGAADSADSGRSAAARVVGGASDAAQAPGPAGAGRSPDAGRAP